ncbi:MAG: hypothetical protein ACPLSM_05090 [Thermosphaera sp.]
MEDSSINKHIILEALFKPIESKLANELGLILGDIQSLTRFRNTSSDVLKFTVKLEVLGRNGWGRRVVASRKPVQRDLRQLRARSPEDDHLCGPAPGGDG